MAMVSDLFDWNEANIAHIAEHDVWTSEAEEIVSGNPLDIRQETRNGEVRLMQIGATLSDRVWSWLRRFGEREYVLLQHFQPTAHIVLST